MLHLGSLLHSQILLFFLVGQVGANLPFPLLALLGRRRIFFRGALRFEEITVLDHFQQLYLFQGVRLLDFSGTGGEKAMGMGGGGRGGDFKGDCGLLGLVD